MHAALAIIYQTTIGVALAIARFIAFKVFILLILLIVLPYVLKKLFIWGMEYFQEYGHVISGYFSDLINTITGGEIEISMQLTSVGGYLAIKTGLIEYCAIIITGWGIYWTIALMSKTTKII